MSEDVPVLVPGAEGLDLAAPLASLRAHGFARLGAVVAKEMLAALRERADAIMLAKLPNERFFFQRDAPSGAYEDLEYGRGFLGPGLDYRKIERLELDPLFARLVENPLYERVTRALTPEPVTLYRATLFTKPAGGGSHLPWHQDDGLFWGIDRPPLVQIWCALDDAPLGGGCLEIVPGSHLGGLARPIGGVVPPHLLEAASAEARAVAVPAEAGDVVLIHNHVWHRSRRSETGAVRRGFTACYLEARTRCMRKRRAPRTFPLIFPGAGVDRAAGSG